jgi:16S rRNA processing protein RimM
MNALSTSGWFPIARLLRPQGRRGELLADPLSDLPDLFGANREVVLAAANAGTPAPGAGKLRIEEHWFPTGKNAGRVVLKLSGCDSISAAEALAGQQLLIASDQLPALDPGTFFVGDLVGCTLYNAATPTSGTVAVGTVVDVEFATGPDGRTRIEDAAPLLAVELSRPVQATAGPDDPEAAEPMLVPFVLAWIEDIDVAARRITMRLPDGLVDASDGLAPPSTPEP